MTAFIFDCDGTLLDSIDAWIDAEEALLSEAGIELSPEDRDRLNTLTLEEAGQWFYEDFGILESPDDLRGAIEERLLGFYGNDATAIPGAKDFVECLHRDGIPMAILSSSPHTFLDLGLSRVGLIECFDEIVSVDDLPWSKRHPKTYEEVCKRLDASPQETWFFDDSYYALAAAQEAGLHTVGVFSRDECGTHEQLASHSLKVIEDFSKEDPSEYLD